MHAVYYYSTSSAYFLLLSDSTFSYLWHVQVCCVRLQWFLIKKLLQEGLHFVTPRLALDSEKEILNRESKGNTRWEMNDIAEAWWWGAQCCVYVCTSERPGLCILIIILIQTWIHPPPLSSSAMPEVHRLLNENVGGTLAPPGGQELRGANPPHPHAVYI